MAYALLLLSTCSPPLFRPPAGHCWQTCPAHAPLPNHGLPQQLQRAIGGSSVPWVFVYCSRGERCGVWGMSCVVAIAPHFCCDVLPHLGQFVFRLTWRIRERCACLIHAQNPEVSQLMIALPFLSMTFVTAAGRDVGFGTTCGFVAPSNSRFHHQSRRSGGVRFSSRSAAASAARMTVSEAEGAEGMFFMHTCNKLLSLFI